MVPPQSLSAGATSSGPDGCSSPPLALPAVSKVTAPTLLVKAVDRRDQLS
jgi:hypothetical protein